MAEEISNIWFDGARFILEQVENLMCDLLKFEDKLDALQKKASEEKAVTETPEAQDE